MKVLQRNFGLFILLIFVFSNSMAQKASYTTNRGLTIGFGAGLSYQKSDLAEPEGLAFDFILGSPLYKKENAFLSVDWKFRFMAGGNKAYDHRINLDNTYSNNHYSFNNYDLELGLTLNRLRERTRIVLTGFVGAGVTHGRTFTDLYWGGNNSYDFSTIDPNRDRRYIYEDLVSLSDGDFETALVNKAALLPTAGFYIGYQISKAIALGFEFKTNFYLTEQNSIVGINLDNRIAPESGLDRNSYTSLGLKWVFGGGGSSGGGSKQAGPAMSPASAPLPGPTVTITDPATELYHYTSAPTHTIRASVNHVNGPGDISFFQNGYPNNRFTYNVSTRIFTANVQLRDGENKFRIKATNQGSSAEDLVSITYVAPTELPTPVTAPVITPPTETPDITPAENIELPNVRFTNPATPATVHESRFSLRADARNVPGRANVRMELNGSSIDYFSMNLYGTISSNLLLSEGINTVEIIANNEAGTVSERTYITYNKRAVRTTTTSTTTTSPAVNPTVTYTDPVVTTTITNDKPVVTTTVTTDKPVETTTNRKPVETSRNRKPVVISTTTNRRPVEVKKPIEESKPTEETKPCLKPEIRLIDPGRGQVTAMQQSYKLRAAVQNIAINHQLKLFHNEKQVQLSLSKNEVNSTLTLISGVNTVSLYGKNECGEESVSARIIYAPPAVKEPYTPPVVEEPITPPVVEEPVTPPVVEEPVTPPVIEEPVIEEPVTPPVIEEPITPPVVEVPVVEEEEGDDDEGEEEEDTCGVRINPGNSAWQFCMVTPAGTFTRDDLRNSSFSYSGTASSLYFMPIGGGGEVTVNGSPYSISSGKYYLFKGNLDVSVSNNKPGSMGHWAVCVEADKAPETGNGNNRPKSPCEEEDNDDSRGKGKKN